MEKQKKGVRLEHISKIYNDPKTGKEFYAVQDTTLDIEPGTFVTLLGPSGCGKTTTLRMIAGFESPDEGEIYLGDEAINSLTPNKRDTAMVFQSYALLPHYNVFDNVAYGLKIRKVPKEEIRERVLNILKLVEMDGMESRMTNQLSGGQQQRVALARALVIEPSVLLFDEPLSNLDAKLRVTMRTEIRKIQQKVGITAIYVTHDQVEAMSMADDIVLMKDGYIVQQSSPRELYNNPNCVYAAQFIGTPQMNIVKDILPEGMQVGFRPEKVYLKEVEEEHVEISAKIATKEMLGSEIIYSLDSPAGKLMAKSDYEAEDESTLKLSIPVKNMYLFDKDGKRIERSIYSRPWIDNESGEIPVTVTLKGWWKVAETPYCKLVSADKKQTVLRFTCKDAASFDVELLRK